MKHRFFGTVFVAALAVAPFGCSESLHAPVAEFVVAPQGHVGDRIALDATTSSDKDGDPLAYRFSLIGVPTGSTATIADPSGMTTWFVPDVPGEYSVQLVVYDGTLSSRPMIQSFTADTCGGSSPRVASITASPATPWPGQAVALAAAVSDSDTSCGHSAVLQYAWSLVGAPPGSRATLNDPSLVTPSLLTDVAGTYRVQLVATDSDGHASTPLQASVTTSGCTTLPGDVTAVGASPGAPSTAETVTLTASVAQRTSSGSSTTTNDAGVPSGTLPDGAVDPTPAPTTPSTGAAAPCTNPVYTYHWTLVGAPTGSAVTLTDNPLQSPSFTPDLPGDYTFEVYVTSDTGERGDVLIQTVTVLAGAVPCGTNVPTVSSVSASPAAPDTFQPVQLSAVATDADRNAPCNLTDSLSYRWSLATVPVGSTAALSGTTQTAPWFTPDVPGTYTVSVVAVDTAGHESAASTVNVTAATCGSASPTATIALAPASPRVGDGVSATATVSDSDTNGGCGLAETFTYSWAFTAVPAGSVATLTSSTAPVTGFTADESGTYTLELRVTDSEGHSSTAVTKSITVAAASVCGTQTPVALLQSFTAATCSGACTTATITPSIASGPAATAPNYSIQLNGFTRLRLDGSKSADADNVAPCSLKQALFYQWSVRSAPVGSQAQWALGGATTNMVAPTFVTDLAGTYQVELLVSDGVHLSSPLVVQIQR